MKVSISFNEEKKGIELFFNDPLSQSQEQRLRDLGFKTKRENDNSIGFKTSEQQIIKWFVRDHPAYRNYAEDLQKALEQNFPLEDVPVYPSYEPSLENIKLNRFSLVTFRFKEDQQTQAEEYIVFDQYVRIAKDIAQRLGQENYGDSLKEVSVFSKTAKPKARELLKEGKVLLGVDKDQQITDTTPVTHDKPTATHTESNGNTLRTVDLVNREGNIIKGVIPPINVQEPFVSRNFYIQDREILEKAASPNLWQITEDDLAEATARQLFELIQLIHPNDYGINVSRSSLLAIWERIGQHLFKELNFPIDPNYPYVNTHTGYKGVKTLETLKGDQNQWWYVAEHWRPIGDFQEALKALDQHILELEEGLISLTNPKTQKPFGKNKKEFEEIEWRIEEFKKNKTLIENFLKEDKAKPLAQEVPNSVKEIANDVPLKQNAPEEKVSAISSSPTKPKEEVTNQKEAFTNSVKEALKKPSTDKLKALAEFLKENEQVDGWMQEGKVKKEFARKGKAAFKELSNFLGLGEFKVSFNAGGVAVSGDLLLMGMLVEGKGIHIQLTPDGVGTPKVLYRSIQHLKDYSGGSNNYFHPELFSNPSEIQRKVFRLLKFIEPEDISTSVKSEPKTNENSQTSDSEKTESKSTDSTSQSTAIDPDPTPKGNTKHYTRSVETEGENSFFNQFIKWFKGEDQHLPVHQITWPFFKKWCQDRYPGLSKEWVKAGWKLWHLHTQMWAKISSLSNGQLSANLQKHYRLLQNSKLVFNKSEDSKQEFKKWVKYNYPWFTDAQIEKLAKEKQEEDELKIKVANNYKRKQEQRIPITKIYISIDRKEVEDVFEFDYTKAEVFDNWEEANQYVQKLKRALIPSFSVHLIWDDVYSIYSNLNTSQLDEKEEEPLSEALFQDYFNILYYAGSAPEQLEEIAGKIIENYQLYSWTPEETETTTDYLDKVVAHMHDLFYAGERVTPKRIQKLAQELKIPTMGQMWEAVELSWLLWYRSIYQDRTPFEDRLEKMVHFWENLQPTYAYSDSSKVMYQQYSTPCPIGAMVAQYCKFSDASKIFEPSAGNGLLLVGADPQKTHVNEIDPTRLKSLEFQRFSKITEEDATQPFPDQWAKQYDAVLTNPPFTQWVDDKWDKDHLIDKYFHGQIGLAKHIRLEHLMAGLALHCMKDDGKAAIIIMGHVYFKDGLLAKYRPFFNWLYRHYWVDDVINLNSYNLYNKQGAVARTMLILISGRKETPEGVAPTEQEAPHLYDIEDSFQNLWKRIKNHIQTKSAVHSFQSPLDKIVAQLKIEMT